MTECGEFLLQSKMLDEQVFAVSYKRVNIICNQTKYFII